MPELPEVETVVRGLREPLIGRTVMSVWYERAKVIRTPGAAQFALRIVGQTFRAVNRRAKYILCQMDHDILAIHLKMTGRLYVTGHYGYENSPEAEQHDRWVRLKLGLDNDTSLHFSDARRFGGVFLIQDIRQVAPDLGPEPLEDAFTVAALKERLHNRHKIIKSLLLDQSFIAGVGNIYADEALHQAGIHPLRAASSLTRPEITRLHRAIRSVLNKGIEYQGASVNWYRKPDGTRGQSQDHFRVYDREGQPCFKCGTPIVKMWVAQRGAHFCPHCQPEK
jgi:formamidopyrimidine-DNA glycosylase